MNKQRRRVKRGDVQSSDQLFTNEQKRRSSCPAVTPSGAFFVNERGEPYLISIAFLIYKVDIRYEFEII